MLMRRELESCCHGRKNLWQWTFKIFNFSTKLSKDLIKEYCSTVQIFWRRMKSNLLEMENSYGVTVVCTTDASVGRYTRWIIDWRVCVRMLRVFGFSEILTCDRTFAPYCIVIGWKIWHYKEIESCFNKGEGKLAGSVQSLGHISSKSSMVHSQFTFMACELWNHSFER